MHECRRRDFMKLAASAFFTPTISAGGIWAQAKEPQLDWPGYARAIVIDALGEPGSETPDDTTVPLTPAMLTDIKTSGVTAVNWTVGAVGNAATVFEETIRAMASAERLLSTYPDTLLKITRAQQINEAKATGRLGIIYGFQDTSMFGSDLERLQTFYDFGVRIIQLTYNVRNLVGDGCLEPADAGLSKFGQAVLEKLNALGVLVDLSHCGQRTTAEAIQMSRQPVAITHAGCRALADLPRNKRDEELRALANKGGFFGIYLMSMFLSLSESVTSADVIRHLEHAINVCGEDHVGIGTDGYISATNITPEYQQHYREELALRRRRGISAPGERETAYKLVLDLNTPRRFEILANLLLARGHKTARVEKILGGNFARLLKDVWH